MSLRTRIIGRAGPLAPTAGAVMTIALCFSASGATAQEVAVTKAVAVVNGAPLYLEDLERRLNATHSNVAQQQRSAPDTRELLDRAVEDILLAQEARFLGMADEEPIPSQLEGLRQKLAVDRLNREEIAGRVEVSEAEVRDIFERQYATATLRIITLEKKIEAEQLLAEVDDDTDFDALARERSIDQYQGRGGLLESIDRGDLPGAVAASAFDAEPGAIVGPLQTGLGWAIVRIESTRAADPARFETVEGEIRRKEGLYQANLLRRRLSDRLWEKHSVSVDEKVLGAIGCTREPDGRLAPEIDNPESVVARIADRQILVGVLGTELSGRWKAMRNQAAALAARPFVLQSMVLQEVLEVEALSRGYGETAEVERAVRAYENQLLITRYLRDVVRPQVTVTDDEIQAAYEEQREGFRRPPRVHLKQITVTSLEEADRLAELLENGTDLGWLAERHSIDRFNEVGGERGWLEVIPGMDPLQDALTDAGPGDVAGPFETGDDRFVVFQVSAREEQGFFDLEEVGGSVRTSVFQRKFGEEVQRLLATLRGRSEITIYDEVLASLQVGGRQFEEQGHGEQAH